MVWIGRGLRREVEDCRCGKCLDLWSSAGEACDLCVKRLGLLRGHFLGSFQHPCSRIVVCVFSVLVENLFYGIVEIGRLRKFHKNGLIVDSD